MKVFITKWVVSGRVELVDLEPVYDGKYFSGQHDGTSYFITKRDALPTVKEAKKRVTEKFKARRHSLECQLKALHTVELEALSALDSLDLVPSGAGGVVGEIPHATPRNMNEGQA